MKTQIQHSIRALTLLAGLSLFASNVFAMGAGHYQADGKTLRNSKATTSTTTVDAATGLPTTTASLPVVPATAANTSEVANAKGSVCDQAAQDKYTADPNSCLMGQNSVFYDEVENGKTVKKLKCDYGSTENRLKYEPLAGPCGKQIYGCYSVACNQAMRAGGLGQCNAMMLDAKKSFDDFKTACVDTGIGSAEECLKEARQCAIGWASEMNEEEEDTDEDDKAANSYVENLLGQFGFGSKKSDTKDVKPLQCAKLGSKEWGVEKRDIGNQLRAAEKELAEKKADLIKDTKEFSDKKKELTDAFAKAQTDTREKLTEAQKSASDAGMQAQESIMGIEDQKASLRAEIIQLIGKKSDTIGARAMALAELSDAMIATNCMAAVEEAAKKMTSGMTYGFQNYLGSRSEKRRRLKGIQDSCYAKAETARLTSYRSFNNQLAQLDDGISNANRRIAALDSQSKGIGTSNAQAIQKAAENEKALSTEQTTAQQSIMAQMAELQASQEARIKAADEDNQSAKQQIAELTSDIRGLGKKPHGTKAPNEAASKFTDFVGKYNSLKGNGSCSSDIDELNEAVKAAKLEVFRDKGVNYSEEDEDTATPSDTKGTP